ncbi:MAG: hypothetical protein H5T99_06735 [Moorella sp. (in: Bacteria)]|nr:hypothetical protein [Moorella sp. (in: firmicutes)]
MPGVGHVFACGVAVVPVVDVKTKLSGPGRHNLYRCFSRREMACCGGGSAGRPLERLAGRLAAKQGQINKKKLL